MPRTKQQVEQLRTQRRQQILQIALELFARQGYHATSVGQIAQAAKISKGLIYNYFQSKYEILVTLIDDIFSEFSEIIRQKTAEELQQQDLEEIVRSSMELLQEDLDVYRLYFMLYMQPDVESIARPKVEQFIEQVVNYLTPYFKKRGISNPRVHILGLLSALDGLALHYILLRYPEMQQILETIIEKYIRL
jgi:AcrR family transcriptional regulator